MKYFVSHKREDAQQAAVVAATLRKHNHEVYLDIIDKNLDKTGDDLGQYLRQQLDICDALIAVISSSTKTSWWCRGKSAWQQKKIILLARF